MERQKPEGNKKGIAPGTELPEPKKPKPTATTKPKPVAKPKYPMARTYGERPSVWQTLADLLHDHDHEDP